MRSFQTAVVCWDFFPPGGSLCSHFLGGARDFVAAPAPAETEQGGPRLVAGPGSAPSPGDVGCTSAPSATGCVSAVGPRLFRVDDAGSWDVAYEEEHLSPPPRAGPSEGPQSDTGFLAVRSEVVLRPRPRPRAQHW